MEQAGIAAMDRKAPQHVEWVALRAGGGSSAPGELPLELACDESGAEGQHLVGGVTDVFTHAAVALDPGDAAECVAEIRRRIRSPATEYKATHLLREKHRAVLRWFLGAEGPLFGNARVQLIDKEFLVVDTVVHVLLGEEVHPLPYHREDGLHEPAEALFQEGPGAVGEAVWRRFLEAGNELVRIRNRGRPEDPVAAFFDVLDALHRPEPDGRVGSIVRELAGARRRADRFRARVTGDLADTWTMDPVLAGLSATVASWTGLGRPFVIVHDEQSALTKERVTAIMPSFPDGAEAGRTDGASPEGFLGLRRVDSQSDPRVQIADFLAGAARRIASDVRIGREDAELTALLRPYVDTSHSLWVDTRSRS